MPVARIGESVSYSDKLRAQADLINKKRQQNLDVEIAQEEKNREFTNQQLQAFYDFDVSGMSPEHIKAIGKLQASMANSLDPNSEDHYQNSEQLIADIAFLNNTYNVASRYRDQRQTGTQQMLALMTGEAKAGPGQEFVNEGMDGLKNANAIWDQGGFSGEINVGGTAGNRSISGIPLVPNPEGGWMEGEGEVNFFESPLTNDPTSIYRPTIIAAPPILSTLAEAAMSDEALNGTNTEEVANLRWTTMGGDKKEQIAREEYERLATDETAAFEDMTEEQKIALGIDDESLKNTYGDRLQQGVDARAKASDTLFDVQRTTEGLTNLKEKITLNVSDEQYAGNIIAADYVRGLNLEELRDADGNIVIPIQVAYVGKNNQAKRETIEPSSPAYQQFIQAVGESGINEMFDRAGYTITTADNAGDDNQQGDNEQQGGDDPAPQVIETADLEQQRLDILEGTGDNEGMTAIEQRAENAKQEAIDSASEEVGFFGRMAGNESRSNIEARPITDFMSPAEKLDYNQAQKDLADIDAQLGGEPNETSEGSAVQGQGPGISYSKPQPPQDIDAFEVGDSKAGSTKEEREFAFKEAVRMAEEAGHPYPEAVAAQYALESGYGQKKAANYNYFGIKSSDAMIKRLAEAGIEATAGDPVATEEIIDGKSQTINDSFLSFKSPEDAFMAYLMFIDTTKKDGERRYGEALDESETALDYLKGIREAGYATANNYADSLNTVAKSFGIDLAEIERKPVGTASN